MSRQRGGVPWLSLVVVLAGAALILADVDVPVLRPLLGAALLLGIPGTIVARWTFGRVRDRVAAHLLAVGLVLLAILLGTLLLNTLGPLLGIDRPLTRPLFVALTATADLALILAARRVAPGAAELRAWAGSVLRARVSPDVGLAALALVLAVVGAVRLNNGLGGGPAIAAHATAVLALGTATALRPRRSRHLWTLYLAGLALLLGTSLRGWYITGHDIQMEYLSWTFTHRAQHWSMDQFPSAYHACLSVNLLPEILSSVMGIPAVVVFKLVVQVLFALVPVIVYLTAERFLAPRIALLGAVAFVFFPTFATDMPYLTRQEVAFLFVSLAVLVTCLDELGSRVRQLLAFLFGGGVVLSHYSTTYMLVLTLGISLVASRLWPRIAERLMRRRAATVHGRRARERPRLAWSFTAPAVVVGVILTAWVWSTPITHTGGHLTDVVGELGGALLHGELTAGSSDLKFIGGGGPSAEERFDDYYAQAGEDRAAAGPEFLIPADSADAAEPSLVTDQEVPQTGLGRALSQAGADAETLNALLRTGAGIFLELLLLVGVLGLLLGVRVTRSIGLEQYWLMLGALGALVTMVAVPGLSADYGVLRAFQQTLILVAPLVGVGLWALASQLRSWSAAAGAAVVVLLGLVLTGAQAGVLGGYPGAISQGAAGTYYEMLYVDQPEMAADQWLARNLPTRPQLVTAGDSVTMTRLQAILPQSATVADNFLPLLLQQGAYVMASPQAVRFGHAIVFHTGDLLTYDYPLDVLERRLSLIHSTGETAIYR